MKRNEAVCFAICVCGLMQVAGASEAPENILPRTSWGDPKLDGVWDYRSATPFERPEWIDGKAYLESDEEAAEYRARLLEGDNAGEGSVFSEPWADEGMQLTEGLRTSLIIDPQTGRLPTRTPGGEEQLEKFQREYGGIPAGPEDRHVFERCIVGPVVPIQPMEFNSNLKIVQTPDAIVIYNEMVHDARIIPIDVQSHSDGEIRYWLGESVGRWEGDTLVVSTRHFRREITWMDGIGPDMHLIEKFSRMGPAKLVYEYTIDDPESFTAPWTSRQTFNLSDESIYEYACHEGNRSMGFILQGARATDAAKNSP